MNHHKIFKLAAVAIFAFSLVGKMPVLAQRITQAVDVNIDGWLWNPSTNHYYNYYAEWVQGSWQVAEDHAVTLGGHLVAINDSAEERWLCDVLYLPDDPNRGTWLGFNDIVQEGNWVWTSGDPVTYTHWLPGEPDNLGAIGANAAAIRYCGSNYGWTDLRIDGKSGNYWGHDYVVEVITGPVAEALTVSGDVTVDNQPLGTGGLIVQNQTIKTGIDGLTVLDAGNPQPARGNGWLSQYFDVQHDIRNSTEVSFPSKMEVQLSTGVVISTVQTWSNVSTNPPASIRTTEGVAILDDARVLTIATVGKTTFAMLNGSQVQVSTTGSSATETLVSPCTAVDTDGNTISTPYTYIGEDCYTISDLTVRSVGTQDGYVLESGENTNVGGTLDSTAATFILGDGAQDKQYRAILSFNTAGLPDNAVITKVTLKIRRQTQVGTNPFTILSGLKVDMRKPFFGTTPGLVISDFQAAAGRNAVAQFSATPVSYWYSAYLNAIGRAYVNKTGVTQFRLRFYKDDNNDNAADYMKFYSGNYATLAARPTLVIEYYVP